MDLIYHLEVRIGETPGFSVHRATHLPDGTAALVKLSSGDAADAARRRAEFALLQGLAAPGIARPLALRAAPAGLMMVFPPLPGVLLESVLAGPGMATPRFLTLARQMVQALAALHAAQLIALDLRPAHWLVDLPLERVRLIDASRAVPDDGPGAAAAPGRMPTGPACRRSRRAGSTAQSTRAAISTPSASSSTGCCAGSRRSSHTTRSSGRIATSRASRTSRPRARPAYPRCSPPW